MFAGKDDAAVAGVPHSVGGEVQKNLARAARVADCEERIVYLGMHAQAPVRGHRRGNLFYLSDNLGKIELSPLDRELPILTARNEQQVFHHARHAVGLPGDYGQGLTLIL